MWASVEVFFNTFISKKKLISVRNESFEQITLGSGSKISQNQEPFYFFWHFCFLLLTCVILSMFSSVEVSRGGFFYCFWGNFGIICFFKVLLLSVWCRKVNVLYLSNACFSDILCRNSKPCSEGFFCGFTKKNWISVRNESF